MNRERWKLNSAVFYFLLVSTMGAKQQLTLDDREIPEDTVNKTKEVNHNTYLHFGSRSHNILTKEDDSPRLELYGAWSHWSQCHLHSCTQTRSKHCQKTDAASAHCAGVVLKEERPCPRTEKAPRRHCDKGSRRSDRRKHAHRNKRRKPPFRVVVNRSGQSVQQIGARSGDLLGRRPGSDSKPSTDNQLTLRGEYKRAYSRWSRWTICTRTCTTQRYRWCKRPAVCGKDVIRETAFCYQEGSACHTIHKDMMRRGTDDNSIYSDRGVGYSIPPLPANPLITQGECGRVTNTTNGSQGHYLANLVRIIGGRPTRPGSWPWQVAVLNRFKEAFCGGTLVAPQWVLTAAHCVRKRLYVRLGEHDLANNEGTEMEMRVEYAVTHPQYDVDTVDNDLALLHLPTPVIGHATACLPRPRQPLPARARRPCTIIGWGKRHTTDVFGTDVLQEAQVPIVSNEECRRVYEDYRITGNMFCAGDRRGRTDSCAGDSGGPLLCRDKNNRWTVFGITSFGEGCGKRGKYGIYTRLPNYVRWVHRVMKAYTTV